MGKKENIQRMIQLPQKNQDSTRNRIGKTITKRLSTQSVNPFLNRKGELVNKYLNYQELLDSNRVNARTKQFITQATGLTSNIKNVNKEQTSGSTSGIPAKVEYPEIKSKSNLVGAAKQYLGTPYVWGGESSSEGGMDCSGFVYNALKDAGYQVGRTTAQGYRSYGNSVKKDDMQPGDLVFFGKDKASHIGIYIGNGQMIHSSGGSKNTKANPGKGVSIANVSDRSDFLEARRV